MRRAGCWAKVERSISSPACRGRGRPCGAVPTSAGESIRVVANHTLRPWVAGAGVEWGSLANRVGLEVRYSPADLEFRTGGDGSALGMRRMDHRFDVRQVSVQMAKPARSDETSRVSPKRVAGHSGHRTAAHTTRSAVRCRSGMAWVVRRIPGWKTDSSEPGHRPRANRDPGFPSTPVARASRPAAQRGGAPVAV